MEISYYSRRIGPTAYY